MSDYALGDLGEIILDKKIRPASESYGTLQSKIKAAQSGDKYAIIADLRQTSDDPTVRKAMAEIERLQSEIESRLAKCDEILAPVVAGMTVSEDDVARFITERDTLGKTIQTLVKTAESVEPGFAEYVAGLELPGVKHRSTRAGTGEGGQKPRVVIEIVEGTLDKPIVNDKGNSSFTTVAQAFGAPKIASEIQAAWLKAAGNDDASAIVEPVTFPFTHGTVTVTLKVSKRLPASK